MFSEHRCSLIRKMHTEYMCYNTFQRSKMKRYIFALTACFIVSSNASASQLVYTPVNPAFGGNPNNYAWLQTDADHLSSADSAMGDTSQSTDMTQQFVQMLETRIYSGLADSVATAIFGSNCAASCSGTVTLGNQSVAYSNDGKSITLQISDVTGKITTISVPTTISTTLK
jgi:curli production assembly/transport component CsgF